jgi:hypothetical protein
MSTWTVTWHDGETATIEADRFDITDGYLVFADTQRQNVALVPLNGVRYLTLDQK